MNWFPTSSPEGFPHFAQRIADSVIHSGRRLWHRTDMAGGHAVRFERRLIDTLYTEAMLLADEARDYFDAAGRSDRERLTPLARVSFSCESLKVTTRLMHVIAWLLTQRAVAAGEMSLHAALEGARRLGDAPASEGEAIDPLPDRARRLIVASARLHARVAQLDRAQAAPLPHPSPARVMIDRLSSAF